MSQNYKKFNEKHQELISFFIELCLTNRDFLKVWLFLRNDLTLDCDLDDFLHRQKISQDSKNLISELKKRFESCIDIILNDGRILKPKKDIKGLSFRLTLTELLNTYIDSMRQIDLPFRPEVRFISALGTFNYRGYKKYIFSKKQVFRIKIFLSNFKLKLPETSVRIMQGLVIEKLDIAYSHYINKDFISSFGNICRAALIFELETERFGNIGEWGQDRGGAVMNNFSYSDQKEKIEKVIKDTLTTLRLLGEGDVGVISIKYEPPGPFSREISLPIPADYQVTAPGLQYEFSNSDLPKFRKIFRGLELLYQTQETEICLSRFNKSYMRNDPVDQIIDLAIAMEAVTTAENNSLTYKISNQVARLLINSKSIDKRIEERKALQEEIKKIYDIRSKLVHRGGKAKGNSKETVYRARQIVREISLTLIKLLPNNKYQDIFNKIIFS